jgi:hypothetical protein
MFDPSSNNKIEFEAAVRVKMASLELTVFPYFTDSKFIRVDLKYVLVPRPKPEPSSFWRFSKIGWRSTA